MAAPVITLADALITELEALTAYEFRRRISPFFRREDIVGGKWIVLAAGDEQEVVGRQVDRSTLTVDVAYQEPLPAKTTAQPDPLENQVWFDGVMAEIEDVKNLFRGDGDLRQKSIAGMTFVGMSNTPIYRPDLIQDYQMFTAVIRLEFAGELAAT